MFSHNKDVHYRSNVWSQYTILKKVSYDYQRLHLFYLKQQQQQHISKT